MELTYEKRQTHLTLYACYISSLFLRNLITVRNTVMYNAGIFFVPCQVMMLLYLPIVASFWRILAPILAIEIIYKHVMGYMALYSYTDCI